MPLSWVNAWEPTTGWGKRSDHDPGRFFNHFRKVLEGGQITYCFHSPLQSQCNKNRFQGSIPGRLAGGNPVGGLVRDEVGNAPASAAAMVFAAANPMSLWQWAHKGTRTDSRGPPSLQHFGGVRYPTVSANERRCAHVPVLPGTRALSLRNPRSSVRHLRRRTSL